MNVQRIKDRLNNIIIIAPEFSKILYSDMSLNFKKISIRKWLSLELSKTYEHNPNIPSLEYILKREAINVFQKILSNRSEKLAGFSMIKYINDILHNFPLDQKPSPAFLAELEHLLKGIMGKSGVYDDKKPAHADHEGAKAAILRSKELSRLARISNKFMDRYNCGLDKDIIKIHNRNKERILKYFKATDQDWNRWQWHRSHVIKDVETLSSLVDLTDKEYAAVKFATLEKIPIGITPYYLSLFDKNAGQIRDRAVRAQVLPSLHYVRCISEIQSSQKKSMDFMLERDTSPIEGITRRYPNVVILKPVLTCPQICVYCQRNWEIEECESTHAMLSKEKLDAAIDWIAKTPEINEVLVTGGDPLILSNKNIDYILSKLASISNIIRIRIGSRVPVTLPQRINSSLASCIANYHVPGKREIILVTHFENSYEITPQAMEAIGHFRSYGIEVYNQLVFTYYNSRKFEAAYLRQNLRLIGVTPYYTFNTKGKEETNDFRLPITRLLQEQKEEARLLPGPVRTDEIVFNVPGLGKNYLRASQHRDIISIFPDGKRVYEFHPWEKKLALVGTYVYHDVPIYNYLKRLKSDGEDSSDYSTIWYYY